MTLMTREEWIAAWDDRLIGMALKGLVDDNDTEVKGPFDAGHRAKLLPGKVHRLLGQMWDSMQPKAAPANNGPLTQTRKATT